MSVVEGPSIAVRALGWAGLEMGYCNSIVVYIDVWEGRSGTSADALRYGRRIVSKLPFPDARFIAAKFKLCLSLSFLLN